jgi:methylamine dehydrogenase accessory protein MauD
MTEALLVSNGVLWLLVLGLCVVIVALVRQIGLLHERIAPVGALATSAGPEVGDEAPVVQAPDLDGTTVTIGGPADEGRHTLLFFLSPTCPVCETLLPTLGRIGRESTAPLRIVYASDGEPAEHLAFRREHGLLGFDYVLSRELGMRFQVAKLPYAVLIDDAGIVRAKGLVNTREHLESLFEAERLGVASIQDYLLRDLARDEATRLEVVGGGGSSERSQR